MASSHTPRRTGFAGVAETVITLWALFGGVVLIALVVVNIYAVLSGFAGRRFSGDFELTEMFAAVAAFCFLPYTQLSDANVTADIFTSRASPRWVALFKLVAALVALLFALLLLWRMYYGLNDQRDYRYTTTILQVPIWWAFVPILVSLALLALAAAINFVEYGRSMMRGGQA
ncbi:TRAP transporter small permease [Plastorhodobacter daqingensis]|uniref:TRAP transporter small permease protein n=1 Tax=Plastorhodobacter daqingensis TaxID=1387281 RepID=A0ABW2UR29_9RHOB